MLHSTAVQVTYRTSRTYRTGDGGAYFPLYIHLYTLRALVYPPCDPLSIIVSSILRLILGVGVFVGSVIRT